jgi:hypothetical protein
MRPAGPPGKPGSDDGKHAFSPSKLLMAAIVKIGSTFVPAGRSLRAF